MDYMGPQMFSVEIEIGEAGNDIDVIVQKGIKTQIIHRGQWAHMMVPAGKVMESGSRTSQSQARYH